MTAPTLAFPCRVSEDRRYHNGFMGRIEREIHLEPLPVMHADPATARGKLSAQIVLVVPESTLGFRVGDRVTITIAGEPTP